MAETKQISMAATTIALRGVRLFLTASRAAVQRRPPPPAVRPRRKRKPPLPANKLPPKTMDVLLKTTKFNKGELEALFAMYRRLVGAAQDAQPPPAAGQPPTNIDGIDASTLREVLHATLDIAGEELVLERVWAAWERGGAGAAGAGAGAAGADAALSFHCWVRGLSRLLRGTDDERRSHCFAVYDLNSDGYITRDEMFLLLKNSLLKQPGDEDPDEGVRDLVELVLRKLDVDQDGKVSAEDYKEAVEREPLLLEAFGQCLPSRRHAAAFLKTLTTK